MDADVKKAVETVANVVVWFFDALILWAIWEPATGRHISYPVAIGVAFFLAPVQRIGGYTHEIRDSLGSSK